MRGEHRAILLDSAKRIYIILLNSGLQLLARGVASTAFPLPFTNAPRSVARIAFEKDAKDTRPLMMDETTSYMIARVHLMSTKSI